MANLFCGKRLTFDLYKWLCISAIGVTMWYHTVLSGACRESAEQFCQLKDLEESHSGDVLSSSFLSGKTEQKRKQDTGPRA